MFVVNSFGKGCRFYSNVSKEDVGFVLWTALHAHTHTHCICEVFNRLLISDIKSLSVLLCSDSWVAVHTNIKTR